MALQPAAYEQFLLLGDSLLQFSFNQRDGFAFGAQLASDYARKLDVINRGFSGYNSAQALRVLPAVIPSPEVAKIRFLLIFLGANDACQKGDPARQHVPLDKYVTNLNNIIHHPSVRAQAPRIILVTPPPVQEHQFPLGITGRAAATTKAYADRCREFGDGLEVPTIDLWSCMMRKAGWSPGQPLAGSIQVPRNEKLAEFLSDGLHLRPAGYEILYDELVALIAKTWPDQMPEKLPVIFPSWRLAEPRTED